VSELRISVLGLGYVGSVSAACFAKMGHRVIGVDVNATKVEQINRGMATIVEEGIAELVKEVAASGHLTATTDTRAAILASNMTLICVGTPSRRNGGIDLAYISRAAEEIGVALRDKNTPHLVIMRSTVLPGTVEQVVTPIIQRASGKEAGVGFTACSNPEFLREGTSIKDFHAPPMTLIGAPDEHSARLVSALYENIDAPIHVVPVAVAESVKYVSNSFHALKVGFANEVGSVLKAVGVDSHEVMRVFCEDRKLNISPSYLKPGFAFGGSCLPKDVRALVHQGRVLDIDTPIMSAVLDGNAKQIDRAYHLVRATGARRIGVLGLAFKAGTDDLRESPSVDLIEKLIGRGLDVRIFDQHVHSSSVTGVNREYIEREIPHIWSLMCSSLDEVVEASEAIVICNGDKDFRRVESLVTEAQHVVDLVRIFSSPGTMRNYVGLCW